MKIFLSLIFLFLFPTGVYAFIPDTAIAFSSRQLGAGKILIASENITSGIFSHAVILLTKHYEDGDVGLIINRPSNYQVKDIYTGFVMADKAGRLFVGGPVMNTVLSVILKAKNDVEGLTAILPNIYHGFVVNDNADRYFSPDVELWRFYSGYAGWGKDQLVNEINRGGWYVIDGDPGLVFDVDAETMWQELLRKVQSR